MSEPTGPDEEEVISAPDEVTVNDNGDPTIEEEDEPEDDGDETETA